MTGLQLVMASGAMVGLGMAMIMWRLVPGDPDLTETLTRLSPAGARAAAQAKHQRISASDDVRDVLGQLGQRYLPVRVWGRVSPQDLAILRMAPSRFYGEKLLFAVVGLLAGPLMTWAVMFAGLDLPFYVPVAASLLLAIGFSFIPNWNLHDDSRKARMEFTRALGAYVDLVALERAAGAGPRQAMEAAAAAGDSWVFARIREELARTRWSGTTPWEAMRQLGEEFGIAELHELADIMRLSGDEGTAVYVQLRARAASMRAAMLAHQKTEANQISERMVLPVSLLCMTFLTILLAPQMLRLLGG